jgi:hypothetical protein
MQPAAHSQPCHTWAAISKPGKAVDIQVYRAERPRSVGGQAHTRAQADGDRGDLLRVQAGDLVRELAGAQVPEAQRAVEVAAHDRGAVRAAAHRVDAAVAHERCGAEAAAQVPHLRAPHACARQIRRAPPPRKSVDRQAIQGIWNLP